MKRRWTSVVMAAVIVLPSSVVARPSAAGVSLTERNRLVMADFVDLFYRQRKVKAAFMAHVAEHYVQHNPSVGDGRDAATAMLEALFSATGARFDVKHVLVDGDMAVVHLRGQPDPKHPPVAVADFYRLKDGKIIEHWDVLQPVTPSAANRHPFF